MLCPHLPHFQHLLEYEFCPHRQRTLRGRYAYGCIVFSGLCTTIFAINLLTMGAVRSARFAYLSASTKKTCSCLPSAQPRFQFPAPAWLSNAQSPADLDSFRYRVSGNFSRAYILQVSTNDDGSIVSYRAHTPTPNIILAFIGSAATGTASLPPDC